MFGVGLFVLYCYFVFGLSVISFSYLLLCLVGLSWLILVDLNLGFQGLIVEFFVISSF